MEIIFNSIWTIFLSLFATYTIVFTTIRIEMILTNKHIVNKKNILTIIANVMPMMMIVVFLILYIIKVDHFIEHYMYIIMAILLLSILIANTFNLSSQHKRIYKDIYFGKKHTKDEIFKIKSKYVGVEIETSLRDAPIRLTIYEKFFHQLDAYLNNLEKEKQLFIDLTTKKFQYIAYLFMFSYILSVSFLAFEIYYLLTL